MNPIGNRLETGVVCGGREAAHDRNQDAVCVPDVLARLYGIGEGILHIPALVDDGVLPTQLPQAGQHGGIGTVVGFVDGEAVGVPAVPAHGRGGGDYLCRGGLGGCDLSGHGEDGKTEDGKQVTA